jgi:UDP-hydrolysing UDP-N-acetyl-D-glucosamine 2-epimerase
MRKFKKIFLVTGSRAEFYLNYNLIKLLKSKPKVKFKLLVTGSHLSKKHGFTVNNIIKKGIYVDKKIVLPLKNSNPSETLSDIQVGIKYFSNYLKKNIPELVILHGDRYELLAPALACFFMNIPIGHISGGEVTHGSKDDIVRHVLTKISSLHFVSTDTHKKRVIQLGENPKTVFNVGDLGIERINELKNSSQLKKKIDLQKKLNFQFNKRNILVTLHPDSYQTRSEILNNVRVILKSLSRLKDTSFLFTSPNADLNNDIIQKEFKRFVKKNSNKARYIDSLGDINYLSVLNYIDCVLGNSSSGIVEVPEFKIPTINIGNRQSGRATSKSVINCIYTERSIAKAIKKNFNKKFRSRLENFKNPYKSTNSSKKIVEIIQKTNTRKIYNKIFYDI